LSTDAPVGDVIRLGMGPWLRSMLVAYGRAFDVELYSCDRIDFSGELATVHHPLGPSLPLPRAIRQVVFHARLIRRARRMQGVVRSLSPNLPVLREIRRLSGSPAIVDYHYDWASTAKAHYGGVKGRIAEPVQRRCIQAADLVVATTRDLARDVEGRYGKRAIRIPNFVDTDLFHPRELRHETILFAGRFHWAKGVEVLIDAFTRIAVDHPRSELVLYGSGELDEELRRRAPDALRERIRFLGSRPQEEVARALGSAAVCALPTLTTEGNPKAVLEAMACGTPLACSAVPGIADLVAADRTGLLVPPGDAGALALALARLLDDRSLWTRISLAGLGRARQFGKERILRHQIRAMGVCATHGGLSRTILATHPGGASTRFGARPETASPLDDRSRASERPTPSAVIVVAYGPDDLLRRCVDSICQQEPPPSRLILVDNNPPGSRCDAASLRTAIGNRFAFDVLVPGTNLGYGRAVNLAVEQVREETVLVSNPDLILEHGLLRRLEEELRSRPAAAAAGPVFTSIDERTPAVLPTRPPRLREEIAGLAGLDRLPRGRNRARVPDSTTEPVDFLSGACFLVRREALADVGGFDPRFFLYYEDADFFRRLRAAGWELLVVPATMARHAHGGTWRDPVRRQSASFHGAILYHRKHGGIGAEIAYRAGLLLLYAPRLLIGALVLGLLGRKSVFAPRDRFRMFGRTVLLAFSTADAGPITDRSPGERRL